MVWTYNILADLWLGSRAYNRSTTKTVYFIFKMRFIFKVFVFTSAKHRPRVRRCTKPLPAPYKCQQTIFNQQTISQCSELTNLRINYVPKRRRLLAAHWITTWQAFYYYLIRILGYLSCTRLGVQPSFVAVLRNFGFSL